MMIIIIIVIFRNYSLLRQVFSWRAQPLTLLEGAPLWPVWVIKRAPAVVLVAILQILQLKSVSHGCHQSQLFWSTVVQWKTSGNMSSSWWSSGDKPKQMEQQGEGRNAPDQNYWWRQKKWRRWEGVWRWGNPQETGDRKGLFAFIVNDPSADGMEPVLPLGCLQSQRICSLSCLHIQPSDLWSCYLKAASTESPTCLRLCW